MIKEWDALTLYQMLILRILGYPYIIIPSACLLWLRGVTIPTDSSLGLTLILALAAIITATDTGAYFVGKRFGRHKMAPFISPNKTWEGLGGGVASAALVGMLFSPYIHLPHSFIIAICVSILMALLAQAGDLCKSWIKRLAGVKDSGSLLPGHGGVLDRLDGYMLSTPVLAFIIKCNLVS
jgi:phosphatidate cytidylyltransferase